MANVYPESVLVTGLMVPCVRTALIDRQDTLKEHLITAVRCNRFQSAFEDLNELNRIHEFLLSFDKLIQFDESDDIVETLFEEF